MNALVSTSGNALAAMRSAAANKAWATRRARAEGRGEVYAPRPRTIRPDQATAQAALAAFEAEAKSTMPDWHRAALALKKALNTASEGPGTDLSAYRERRTTARPKALPAPNWPDYPVNRVSSFNIRNPTLVVTFADGTEVRAPAVSAKGKPVNIGRGLRVAIAFYTARICRRLGLRDLPGTRPEVPEITSCVCEDDGAVYDPIECSARTVETRRAQDWKISKGNGR